MDAASKPKTFFVPGASLTGQSLEKGSRLTLEVVFVDPENNDVEVKLAGKPMSAEEELRPDLQAAFPTQAQGMT
jgi:hypothetical protein